MKFKSIILMAATLAAFACNPSATPDPGPDPGPTPGPKPDDKIPVASVSLNQTSIALETGDTFVLEATVLPSNATDASVSWESDNPSIATVTGGTVTAIAEGSAKITAKAGEKSAVCKVTVTEKPVAVESVTLDITHTSINLGESLQLTATVLPENAADKTVTWASSDPAVATVADGVVTTLAAGFTRITATAGGISAACEITVIDNRNLPVDQNGNVIYPEDDYGTFN